MLIVQIIFTAFSLAGFIAMLVSLPGQFGLPHLLPLLGFLLTGVSIIIKRKWVKALLFIAGALGFALFLGFMTVALNALSALGM